MVHFTMLAPMYIINVYESSREDPSMYKVGNRGEREDNITRKEEERKEVGGFLFVYI